MGKQHLTILGSTGSIGRNTLDVVARFPDRFRVHALAARNNVELLCEQIAAFQPALAVMYEAQAAQRLRAALPAKTRTEVLTGMEGLTEAARCPEVQHVISGMVGAVGLLPTYAAIASGKRVSIANKETLVLAGELMVRQAAETGSTLIPMDSEHNAIFQCLASPPGRELERIVLTASGGPFRDLPVSQFHGITREQALAHPNWKMGPKISIDSATMMNKGLEVIEARWLFGLTPERIEVLVHRQSIVHSMVEFVDGSVIAQLGLPDMRTPIAYCLSYPSRLPLELPRLNLAEVGRLEFETVDAEKYPCLALALHALAVGGGAPAALNGANEEVVAAYLKDAFHFTEIAVILKEAMAQLEICLAQPQAPSCLRTINSVEDAIAADQWGRDAAHSIIQKRVNTCC
ncbi:MAG: 1-deoxy-D-xylulose-5-phosphate reductoisomerase [SAR324 cluster bacterium]|nr:1-deoxy-D-xylulose-5-phosphate reductoisomerase [SAR324 cluster bacterium]